MLPLHNPERQSTSEMRRRHFHDASKLDPLVPEGFPSLAVTKTRWANTATFRTFEYLNWRQLEFYQTKIAFLEQRLLKLDNAEDKKMGGSQRSCVPFDKKSFDDVNLRDSDPLYLSKPLEANEDMSQEDFRATRERIFEHIDYYGKKYRELVCWIEKSKTFTRVSTQSHGQLLTMTKEVHKLDNEALDHWIDMDEMAYVSIDPVELWISNAHLSATPLIKKIFQWLPTRVVLPGHNGSQMYETIGADVFKVLHKALVVLFGLSSVLVPGGLLELGGLSKQAAFGIVAGFGAVFAYGTVLVEKRIGHIVVVIVAYLAVLATFLSNMP